MRRHRSPTEDRDFLADARELLPPEPWDETTWSQWTEALKDKTGRKGRALFHPLRARADRPRGRPGPQVPVAAVGA